MQNSRIAASIGLLAILGIVVAVYVARPAPTTVEISSDATSAPSRDSVADARSTITTTPTTTSTTGTSATTVIAPVTTTTTTPTEFAEVPELPDHGIHPELRDIEGWLQSDITSLEELKGKVVAVQFWTYGCYNCKNTIPHMQALYEKYDRADFEIVGIHAPEFDHEAKVDNIEQTATDLGVTWPIALDTNRVTFHHWQEGSRAFWPRIYLLDRDGHVRYDHIGEGRYDEIDAAVGRLIAET